MYSKVSIVYLAAYICISLIQYAHPPVVNQYPYVYMWAIAPFLYPFCLSLAHIETCFWKGLLTILLIPVMAQTLECALYLFKTNGFQSHDFETVFWFSFYLIGPLCSAIIWYPIGYLAMWLLARRRVN